jgi:hypothetical protein
MQRDHVLSVASRAIRNCARLRRNFESREAIYIEKGAIRVRVSNIRADREQRFVAADVEEVPTPRLRTGLFANLWRWRRLRWEIGGGEFMQFSDHSWNPGCGSWSMFFAPRIVRGVIRLAQRWPRGLGAVERYDDVLRWLDEHDAREPCERVFPDDEYDA